MNINSEIIFMTLCVSADEKIREFDFHQQNVINFPLGGIEGALSLP